jgi:hypothetical protein
LTHDEIHVIAAGLMQVSIIDKKRIILENGFRIWVKIKAKVSTGKTEEFGSKGTGISGVLNLEN